MDAAPDWAKGSSAETPPDWAKKTSPASQEKSGFTADPVQQFAYGAITGGLGVPGDTEKFLFPHDTSLFPTTPEVQKDFSRIGIPQPDGLAEKAGEYFLPAAGAAELSWKAGTKLIPKLADTLGTKLGDLPIVRELTGAGSKASTAKLAEGLNSEQIGKNILSRANKAVGRRKDVADNLYQIAEDRMNARFSKGDTWQASKAGKDFFDYIRSQVSIDKATKVSSDTRKIMLDVAKELMGTPRKGGEVALSTPKVLISTLRELREAAAGDPKEGFKALGQQEAGDLARRLSDSLGKWEGAQQAADKQYMALTKKLYPEGVTPGKFGKEKKAAEQAVNLLETRLKQGTLKPDEVTKSVRTALKSKSVARLIDPGYARQINADLDRIDALRAKEDRVRAMAKFIAKWVGAGVLGAAGIDLLKGSVNAP